MQLIGRKYLRYLIENIYFFKAIIFYKIIYLKKYDFGFKRKILFLCTYVSA